MKAVRLLCIVVPAVLCLMLAGPGAPPAGAQEQCDVWILKHCWPEEVSPGQPWTLELDYGNFMPAAAVQQPQQGGGDAENVKVVDFLPDGVTYVSSNPPGSYNPITHTVTWELGTVPWMGSGSLTIETAVASPVGNTLTNVVSISTTTPDMNYENNVSSCSVSVVYPYLNVFVDKWARWLIQPGMEMDYALYLGNSGALEAPGAVLVDHLPGQVDFVHTSRGYYDPGQHRVVMDLGTLPPSTRMYECIRVRVHTGLPPGTLLHNVVEISTTGEDQYPDDNQRTWETWVEVAHDPNDKRVFPDGDILAGTMLNYIVRYENTGNAPAYDVFIVDFLPEELDQFTLDIADGGHYDWGRRMIVWYVGTVPPGAGGAVRFRCATLPGLAVGTTIINWATVYFPSVPEETRTNPVANRIVAEVPNQPPVCEFTYDPWWPREGETVTFDGSTSSDPDGTIVSWEWDFDDGTSASGAVVTHAYAAAGDYEVTLTVTDDGGLWSFCWATVTVEPGPRILCFRLKGPCWHMIAIPCRPEPTSDPWEVLDELRPPNQALDLLSGNLHRYDHALQKYVTYWQRAPGEFGDLGTGDGYWLWVFEDVEICYEAYCPDSWQNLYFVTSGWYLMGGSRFPRDVYLDDTAWYQGIDGPYPFSSILNLWVMDPLIGYSCDLGRYTYHGLLPTDEDRYLRAFQGYWMYTFEDDLTMGVPPP